MTAQEFYEVMANRMMEAALAPDQCFNPFHCPQELDGPMAHGKVTLADVEEHADLLDAFSRYYPTALRAMAVSLIKTAHSFRLTPTSWAVSEMEWSLHRSFQ